LRRGLEDVIPRQKEFVEFRLEGDFPAIGHRVFLLSARPIASRDEQPDLILLSMEDVTDAKEGGERGERREERGETRMTKDEGGPDSSPIGAAKPQEGRGFADTPLVPLAPRLASNRGHPSDE
jgi:hypothetical protein